MRRDAQRNTERLKAAALEVFQERGLGAPLEEIARRAGVSVGTLYNRLGSRELLIDAVVPEIAKARLDAIRVHAEAAPDPVERVARFLTGLTEMQIADPALSDAIASAHPDSPELVALCDANLDLGARLLDAARGSGAIGSDFGRDDITSLLVANAALIRASGPDAARRMVAVILAGVR